MGRTGAKLAGMATRDQLHREVDELSEPQVPRARIIVVDEPEAEDDVVGLPETWKNFEDGTPQPMVMIVVLCGCLTAIVGSIPFFQSRFGTVPPPG